MRFTYEAHVTSPPDVMVLMSADNDPGARRDGDYRLRMPQPIPSYLLAIAAGDLVFRAITPRIGIWAEPGMVARASSEFADAGRMMDAAEGLYGPYRWTRYDLLILPPSFPYGGMENPRLTFVSPTVITGDRSLVGLVAHELAHSWSGNLVTFSSNRDMWLNEGFTTYVESRIIEALYGRDRADLENLTARNELRAEFTDANRALQSLVIPPGALPDPDGMRQEEFDAWLYEPGIPPTAPPTVSPRLEAVDAARNAWLAGGPRPAMAEYLRRVGRRRLVLPTYRALASTPDGLAFARGVLDRAREGLHPLTVRAAEAALTPATGANPPTP